MNEDRDAQLRRHRQHGAQVGMVEMPLPRAAAQERPLEAEVANRAFQLARRGQRIGCGEGGEALEAVGPPRTGLRHAIVDASGPFDGRGGFQIVQPRRGQGQDLNVHPPARP